MSRELILLGNSQGQSDAEIDLEPLCRMKVPGGAGENPIVVFAAEYLGRQLISGFRVGSHFTLLPLSSLAPEWASLARTQSAIFFEQPEQIARYFRDGENFDFAAHIVPFQEAERRVQNIAL
jgi:hypothetical protein